MIKVGEKINDGRGGTAADVSGVYVCLLLSAHCSGEICGANAIMSGGTAKLLALNISSRIEPELATE